jgi:hypothetical protein
MATTTTNYGFDIPQSTDLVKDGATAIATLGQDIDTAMNTALGTKKAGMVLLNTTSFSGVTSVSLPASTFTSTYKNYRVIFRSTQNTTTGTLSMRLRAAGTDLTAAEYTNGGIESGVTENNARVNATGGTSWGFFSVTAGNINQVVLDLLGPQVSAQTIGFYNAFTTNKGDNRIVAIQVGNSNSYDSLSFLTSGGTFTGAVEAYGYNV